MGEIRDYEKSNGNGKPELATLYVKTAEVHFSGCEGNLSFENIYEAEKFLNERGYWYHPYF